MAEVSSQGGACSDLVKQQPRFLSPDGGLQADEVPFLAVESTRVKVDRGRRVGGVQVQVVEMRDRDHARRLVLCGTAIHGAKC